MGNRLNYAYDCVNPIDLEELHFIIDNGEEISREDFLEVVNLEDLENLETALGYCNDFKMEDDYCVNYWKTKYKGNTIYHFCQSGIEYVFKE